MRLTRERAEAYGQRMLCPHCYWSGHIDALRDGACPECDGMTQPALWAPDLASDLLEAMDRIESLETALRSVVGDIDGLIGESDGVAGLHHNGEIATWDELVPGGVFGMWLDSLTAARKALEDHDD